MMDVEDSAGSIRVFIPSSFARGMVELSLLR